MIGNRGALHKWQQGALWSPAAPMHTDSWPLPLHDLMPKTRKFKSTAPSAL